MHLIHEKNELAHTTTWINHGKSTEVKGAKYGTPCFMTPVSMKHTKHGHPRGHKASQGAPGHEREGKYDC